MASPNEPEKTSKPEIAPTSKHSGKVFRVVKPFGPWTDKDLSIGGKPNCFDAAEFIRLHPLQATKDDKGNRIAPQCDPATYHDDLLDRALAIGVIVHDPAAQVTNTPLGPSNSRPSSNPIRESTERLMKDKELRASIQTGMRKAPPDRVKEVLTTTGAM